MNNINNEIKDIIYVNTKLLIDKRTMPVGVASNHEQILAVVDQAMSALEFSHSKDMKQVKKDLKDEQIKELNRVLDGVVVSSHTPWNPGIDLFLNPRQQMLFKLIRGEISELDELYNDKKLLSAAIYKKDKLFLAQAKDLIQKIFDDMIDQIQQRSIPMSKIEGFHMEMIIGDLLALYPFLRPDNGGSLRVPVQIEEGGEKIWGKIDYTIDKISLTPRWMVSPITAYGLHAKNAAPFLLFKGTTYPTDKGFALSLLTDLNPISSIGSYVFNIGKSKIKSWLNTQTKDLKATVVGKSLGGIESCLVALNFPDQVEKVMAYGAPGFSPFDLRKLNNLRKKREENGGHFPEINVFCQKNDPVPYCDHAARKGVNYYQVLGTAIRNGILAHADMYSTHKNSMILKLDPNIEAQKIKRVVITTFRAALSFFAFPFLLLLYIVYTIGKRTVHHFI